MNRRAISSTLILFAASAGILAQKPKSQPEFDAVKAMLEAQDPDGKIQAAENLITKFADTEFKPIALYLEATAYVQKNDFAKMVVYAERALEADPKDYRSMLLLANGIAQKTRENDLDKEEKLARAEKYANGALALIKDAPRPNPQLTDEQWAGAKKDYEAEAHRALGMIALTRKKTDVAVTEFKAAAEGAADPDPSDYVRLGAAYDQAGKYDDAIAVLDKVMADPKASGPVKQFAQAEKVRATQAKTGAAKPAGAKPPENAPGQVEIRKP